MKSIITLVIVVVLIFFLRVNLPPNDISSHMAIKDDANLFEGLALRGVATQIIAEWNIIDLLIVKVACSDRLEMSVVAFPFSKWYILDQDVKQCW